MLLINNSFRSVGALGLLMVAASAAHAGSVAPQKSSTDVRTVEQGRRLLADRSARFIENKGQWASKARFLAQGKGLNLWYTDNGIRYDQISADRHRHQAVDMVFVGGSAARPVGRLKTNSRLDVYHGKTSITHIGSYRELMTKNVVPGVSMRGYFDAGHPRYDLIVAPGTNPSSVRLGFHGSNGLSLDKGALKVGTQFGGFFNGKPLAYQMQGDKRVPVAARWSVGKNGTAGFVVGRYDENRPLVIDPLIYGTYFGGEAGPDEIRAAVTDTNASSGGLVIVGSSSAADFPATSRPFTDTLNPEGTDAFIARIVPAGNATDFSVLVGGEGTDVAQFLKVDPLTGDLWFAGTTTTLMNRGNTFPAVTTNQVNGSTTQENVIGTNGSTTGQTNNFFVGRFTHLADGTLSFGDVLSSTTSQPRTAVVFGTGQPFVSGQPPVSLTGFDLSRKSGTGPLQFAFTGVTDNALPSAFITGTDNSTEHVYTFPSHHAGFLIRFSYTPSTSASSAFGTFAVNNAASQYITGSYTNEARGVALDALGNAYVVGTVFQGSLQNVDTSVRPDVFYTTATTFDTNGTTVLPRILRSTDVFVRIYGDYSTATGPSAITFSGLIGGNGDDQAGGAAASLSVIRVGDHRDFFGNLTPQYASLPIYTGSAIAIDADQNIYITGTTRGTINFPHTAGAYGGGFVPPTGTQSGIASDVFVARLRRGGIRLDYAANLGASARLTPVDNTEDAQLVNNVFSFDAIPTIPTTAVPAGIVVDSQGYVYVTGNLRPHEIVFPQTAGTPNEPTSSTPSTIPLTTANATTGAVAASNTDYGTPSAGPFPSTEAFLTVLKPDFTTLQLSTYVGGALDDIAYAPSIDSLGHVLIVGSTDGGRTYTPAGSTSGPYMAFSGLPGLISGSSVKSDPDSQTNLTVNTFGYGVWSTMYSNTPPTERFSFGRDGFVASIDAGIPAPVPVAIAFAFSPATIDPLGTSVATVTLSTVRTVDTRLVIDTVAPGTIDHTGSFDINGDTTIPAHGPFFVTVPAGSTSITFPVHSRVYGNGVSESFVATVVDTTTGVRSTVTSQTATATVRVSALSYRLSLDKTTLTTGGSSTVNATVTLVTPSPLVNSSFLTFELTVPRSAGTLFNTTTAAFNPRHSGDLHVAFVSVMQGKSSAIVALPVNASSAGSAVITASLYSPAIPSDVTVTEATTSLAVKPPNVISIVPSKTLLRSTTDSVTFTITFDSDPANGASTVSQSSIGFSLTAVPSSVFTGLSGNLTRVGSTNSFKVTTNINRVSRSQDVTVTASAGSGSSLASTTVTVIR